MRCRRTRVRWVRDWRRAAQTRCSSSSTSTYCILTYSSFAYQQFIRPRLVSSLSQFVAYHHLLHWVLLGVTVATLLPEWKTTRGRIVAWAYVAAMGGVGLLILYRPVLPAVENDSLGLWLACAFLVPPIWLAVYDHLAAPREAASVPADTGRVIISAALAGLVVWALSAATAPLRFGELGEYTTTTAALVFGAAVSLAGARRHLHDGGRSAGASPRSRRPRRAGRSSAVLGACRRGRPLLSRGLKGLVLAPCRSAARLPGRRARGVSGVGGNLVGCRAAGSARHRARDGARWRRG